MSFPLFDKVFSGAPALTSPPLTGADLRDSGIESVLAHTPEAYRAWFMGIIQGFPRSYEFTIEEVRNLAGDPPAETHRNAFGALMRTAAKQNLIALTNESRVSARSTRRAGRLAVWKRL